jgi:sulfide:quinone oxidoreductase
MPATDPVRPLHVVIVGGGIAALEAVLALHDLAGERVRLTLIAPEPDFVSRPFVVAEPFARGHVDPLPLAQVMAEHGGEFVRSAVLGVDASRRTLKLVRGQALAYDVLLLAHGATEVPAFEHALTFGEHPLALNGILRDLEEGWSRSAAFVVPPGCTWPLPLYELALMTAEEVWSMNMDRVELHVVTPEAAPLAVFGPEASAEVARVLRAAGLHMHYGVEAAIPANGRVALGRAIGDLVVDRVIALPLLEGRRIDGVPCDSHGFIGVDDAGLVTGLRSVYAVGDATDRPIKQGGLACQQADVAAAHIATLAGADVEVPPLHQALRGRLLTGTADRFLRRDPAAGVGAGSDEPLWWPPVKVSSRYLTPYLAAKDIVDLPVHRPSRRHGSAASLIER